MPSSSSIPKHFIVIIPGYMGSRLRDRNTGEVVWVDFNTLPAEPWRWDDWLNALMEKMTYPYDALEPAGLVEEVQFLLPWAKQEHYGRLLDSLEKMGYRVDPDRYDESERDVYTFPYDWRQDNRISARQLGEAIERWRHYHPGAKAWLMGHSNGGIVARWYIEKEGGADRVGRLILFASPWDGAPKALGVIKNGLEMMWRRVFSLFDIQEQSRRVIRSFPSAYQLIPVQNPFLHDPDNRPVNPFENALWLDNEKERQLLRAGRRFNQELGIHLSVETLCFFGRRRPTITAGVVHFEAGGHWREIDWLSTEAGDGTVPERSAVHPQAAAKLPFVVGHGDIYADPAVLTFLEWELRDKYLGATRASLTTSALRVLFEPDKDVYAPGERILLRATVQGRGENAPPLSRVRIQAELTWRGPLPGARDATPPSEPAAQVRMHELRDRPGHYRAELTAPQAEGYYRIQARVAPPGQRLLRLEETIAVEAAPPIT